MQKGDLTYRIIGCAMNVHNELGPGFMEYIYCRALAIELRQAGIAFEREVWLPIHFKQYRIGYRRCDFLCQEGVVVEAKARRAVESRDKMQAINTVRVLNQKDGLLINFGGERLEYNHIFNNRLRPASNFIDVTPELVGEKADSLFSARHYMPDWLVKKMQEDRLKGKLKT